MQWSRLTGACLLGMALVLPSVYGHGRLTLPRNREDVAGRRTDQQNAPAPYGPSFACKGVGPQAIQATLVAGQDLPVMWDMEAPHVGDCFFYLSYDADKPEDQMEFFKIAQISECDTLNRQRMTIRIPEWVPPCERCVLRFEWYALQQVVNIEFYANCVDVRIQSNAANPALGTPRIRVPGHLPRNNPTGSGNYRDPYNPPRRLFFTGPALSTPDRGNAPQTTRPTAPVTTRAATTTAAPVTTRQPVPTTTAAPVSGECIAVRADNRCGRNFGNAPCRAGQCCSVFGYCGTGADYCNGCDGNNIRNVEAADSEVGLSKTSVAILSSVASLAVAGVAQVAVMLVLRSRKQKQALGSQADVALVHM